jgi:hypothetical protein
MRLLSGVLHDEADRRGPSALAGSGLAPDRLLLTHSTQQQTDSRQTAAGKASCSLLLPRHTHGTRTHGPGPAGRSLGRIGLVRYIVEGEVRTRILVDVTWGTTVLVQYCRILPMNSATPHAIICRLLMGIFTQSVCLSCHVSQRPVHLPSTAVVICPTAPAGIGSSTLGCDC